MATQLCQRCKQAHPGRVCDYDERGECAETIAVNEVDQILNDSSKDDEDEDSLRSAASKPSL
jgi:hypothetical protein